MATPLRAVLAIVTILGFALPAQAQIIDAPQYDFVTVRANSGWMTNDGHRREVIWSELVRVPGAPWVRLHFTDAVLGRDETPGSEPTMLRITSLKDGAVQTMRAIHVQQWGNTTAYFNGDSVVIELIADPGAAPSRVAIDRAMIGTHDEDGIASICGPDDDRLPSDDPRCGRLMPIECSAWLIDDDGRCFLTAGHCTGFINTMQFNVPLSDSNGNLQHPGPEDQYAIDLESLQSNGGQGVGDDWATFGCFSNSTTGLTAFQTQGASYILASTPPSVNGQDIRITGYGSTSNPIPPQWNKAQKTHLGPYAAFFGSTVQYTTDTTGGNSGSPVIDESTGMAIGIHTHGGCGNGANNGTGINHAALQNALANPLGVCVQLPPCDLDNDTCASARIAIHGTEFWCNDQASASGIPSSCGTMVHEVWFRHTPPANNDIVFSTANTQFDTGMVIHEGCACPPGPELACSDDEVGLAAQITLSATAGQCYLIRVGGFSAADVGVGQLSVTNVLPHTLCTLPVPLPGSGSTSYTTLGSTTDGPDHVPCAPFSEFEGDLWYKFVTPVDGMIHIDTCDADYDSRLAVYDGTSCPVNSSILLACNDDGPGCGEGSSLSFSGEADRAYRVRVGGAPGSFGSGTLTIDIKGKCAADINGDGTVGPADLSQLLDSWGACPGCPADLNADGDVGPGDLAQLLALWGEC